MTDEIVPIINDGIEELLEKYSPSELDPKMSRMCPFYEDDDSELTSAYGSIHRFVQSRLLASLQLELNDLSIVGEVEDGEGGRIDGAVSKYEMAVNGKKIEIQNGNGEEVRELAVLEVKTGRLGPFQSAAYAYRWSLPVIVAEMKTGDVHLVDQETARKFLSEAASHMEDIERLRKKGQKIPDLFQCRDCGNRDCEHRKNEKRRTGNGVIRKKRKVLESIGEVTEKIISTLKEILGAKNQLSDVKNIERIEVADGNNSENREEGS